MQSTLWPALAIALGGVLSPGSALLTLLLLSLPKGLQKAFAYYLGYFGSYLVIGVTAVWIIDKLQVENTRNVDNATAWLSFAFGAMLLLFALRTWRTSSTSTKSTPKFFSTVEQLRPSKLVVFGSVVSVLNVKNLSIFLSAISVIVDARLPFAQSAFISAMTAWVFCMAVLVPIFIFALGKNHTAPLLQRLRLFLEENARVVMRSVFLIFGSLMVGRGMLRLFS